MPEHSPEPWFVVWPIIHEEEPWHLIRGKDGYGVCLPCAVEAKPKDTEKANAERIVACVNAMQGVQCPAALMAAVRDAVATMDTFPDDDDSFLYVSLKEIRESLTGEVA